MIMFSYVSGNTVEDSMVIRRICGTHSPVMVYSSTNEAIIQFTSGGISEKTGFTVTVEQITMDEVRKLLYIHLFNLHVLR